MDIKQVILGGIFGVVLQLGAVTPEISSVVAQQRYQSNGLVDVTVTMQGASNDVARAVCTFVATNCATKSAIPVAHIMQNGDVAGEGTIWTRKFIWDAKADVGEVKIEDIELTVAVELPLGGVQLWEGGPYWAECNVGATKPEECGYYFWWGDTVGYKRNAKNDGWISVKDSTSFSFSDCPTSNKSISQLQSAGYIDSTGNLVAAHDAATVHLGIPWRMPTDAECVALINNCTTTWTTRNGVVGRLVTGKGAHASKSIFLPAAGIGDTVLRYLGLYGYYWSSTPNSDDSDRAWYMFFSSSDFYRYYNYRVTGRSVRPLRDVDVAGLLVEGMATTHLALDFRVQPLPQGGPYTETVDGIEWTFMVNADLEVCVGGGSSSSRAISESTTGEITIPSVLGGRPVTGIGDYAFRVCSGLTSVTIPPSVTSVGWDAFYECSHLTSVHISDLSAWCRIDFESSEANPLHQARHLFLNGKELENLIVPADVTQIHDYAFYLCEGLKSVVLHDGVTSIGAKAFCACRSLDNVVIPDSVMNFGESVFEDTPYWENLSDGFVIINNVLLGYKGPSPLNLAIPEGVIKIADEAFYYEYDGTKRIDSVEFPSTLKVIGKRAFYMQELITSLTIPEGVFEIGDEAFYRCKKLSSIVFPKTLKTIGRSAFELCSTSTDLCGLKKIEIEASGLTIAERAFYNGGRTDKFWDLTISLTGENIDVGESAFWGFTHGGGVTLDLTGVSKLGAHAFGQIGYMQWYWVNQSDPGFGCVTVKLSSELKKADRTAFAGGALGTVKFDELDSILNLDGLLACLSGRNGWYDCNLYADDQYIDTIGVNVGATEIPDYAFAMSELSAIGIPEGVVKIGDYAFQYCSDLKSIELPSTVRSIGTSAFQYCSRLQMVTIPSIVTNIGDFAFSGCKSMTAVTIPEGVTSIGRETFYNCAGLVSVTIPKGVIEIGPYAFQLCTSLRSVDFEGTPPDGVCNASVNKNAAIRYNAKYESEWLPVISECGWTNVTPYTPDSDSVVLTLQELASVFGKDSDVVKNIKGEAELATFNEFLMDCSIGTADDLTEGQKQYVYQSFKLSEIVTTPRLFEEEPVLKIDDIELTGGNLSLTISLTAGAEAIQLARDKLAEKIRVGTTLGDITGKPTIVARPAADGSSLTFIITQPAGNQGFVKIQVD